MVVHNVYWENMPISQKQHCVVCRWPEAGPTSLLKLYAFLEHIYIRPVKINVLFLGRRKKSKRGRFFFFKTENDTMSCMYTETIRTQLGYIN